MGKTSIYLKDADVSFVLTKGANVSEGVRYCIDYTRNADGFKKELRSILGEQRCESIELPENTKNKILEIMDD